MPRVLFEISMELGIPEKSNREGICAGIDARERIKKLKYRTPEGHEICNYKEYQAATAEDFTRNKHLPTITNNRRLQDNGLSFTTWGFRYDSQIMPIEW